MMKQYLLKLLELCSEEQFGQDAVEWAITSGFVKLTYDLEADLHLIMGELGRPETGLYPAIVEGFQRTTRREWTDGDGELLADTLHTTTL